MKKTSNVIYQGEKGGFKVTLSKVWLKVETLSKNKVSTYTPDHTFYLRILDCVGREDFDTLYALVANMYLIEGFYAMDKDFASKVTVLAGKVLKKQQKQAEKSIPKNAKEEVTEEEKVDLEWVKRAIERGKMSWWQRRKAEKEFAKEVKQK